MTDWNEDEALVEVWRTWGEAEARIVQGLLEASGIQSAIRGESTRLTHGFTLDGLAEVRILVREQDLAEATEVIASSGQMGTCPRCEKPVRPDDVLCRFCKEPLQDG